ncbi:hypothetical protein FA13DRAFT_1799605 [Coprinellus micaceus]|uniref:Uncharacterized protein n=1 Tax=Coprinellus micaceus TaxID=71717 RepID=A0A4Y7SIH4_COPMI|nr:hypothetical protein FA13DRAFT_1799605 [Coprinellus micaceus]
MFRLADGDAVNPVSGTLGERPASGGFSSANTLGDPEGVGGTESERVATQPNPTIPNERKQDDGPKRRPQVPRADPLPAPSPSPKRTHAHPHTHVEENPSPAPRRTLAGRRVLLTAPSVTPLKHEPGPPTPTVAVVGTESRAEGKAHRTAEGDDGKVKVKEKRGSGGSKGSDCRASEEERLRKLEERVEETYPAPTPTLARVGVGLFILLSLSTPFFVHAPSRVPLLFPLPPLPSLPAHLTNQPPHHRLRSAPPPPPSSPSPRTPTTSSCTTPSPPPRTSAEEERVGAEVGWDWVVVAGFGRRLSSYCEGGCEEGRGRVRTMEMEEEEEMEM